MASPLTDIERHKILCMSRGKFNVKQIAFELNRSLYAINCVIEQDREHRIKGRIESLKKNGGRKVNGRWIFVGSNTPKHTHNDLRTKEAV